MTFEKTERKCIDCNFLTYMFGKTWCNIKCENPHDKVCDRFKPKTEPQTHTVDLGNGFSITANDCDTCKHRDKPFDDLPCDMCCKAHSGYEPKDEPQINPCDGCVCDDGKHFMYCMNCKGIAVKTEPPKVEDEPQTERSE